MNWYLNNRKTVVLPIGLKIKDITLQLPSAILYNQSQEIIENSVLKQELNAFIDVLQAQAAQSSNKIDLCYEAEVFLNL